MKFTHLLMTVAATALMTSAAAAQNVLGDSATDTRLEDLSEDIADDFERDVDQFGNQGRATGYTGSIALRSTATSGNDDTASIGIGANMGYYDGVNGFDVGFSYARAENNGDIDEDNLLYDLQYTRDLSAATYGFANLTGEIDGRTVGSAFDTSDNYLGVGFGYRAVDTATTQWTIQAGLGYRLQESTGVARTSLDEPAISISSGYYNQFTETLALNFDTDIIGSDSNTTVRNEIGLNVSMTDTLALRTSLNTVFNTEPAAGLKDTDNTLGVSLVYNFR